MTYRIKYLQRALSAAMAAGDFRAAQSIRSQLLALRAAAALAYQGV